MGSHCRQIRVQSLEPSPSFHGALCCSAGRRGSKLRPTAWGKPSGLGAWGTGGWGVGSESAGPPRGGPLASGPTAGSGRTRNSAQMNWRTPLLRDSRAQRPGGKHPSRASGFIEKPGLGQGLGWGVGGLTGGCGRGGVQQQSPALPSPLLLYSWGGRKEEFARLPDEA